MVLLFGDLLKELKVSFTTYFYLQMLIKLAMFKNVSRTTEAELQSWQGHLMEKGFSDEEMEDLEVTAASQCGTCRKSAGTITRALIGTAIGAAVGLYASALILASSPS